MEATDNNKFDEFLKGARIPPEAASRFRSGSAWRQHQAPLDLKVQLASFAQVYAAENEPVAAEEAGPSATPLVPANLAQIITRSVASADLREDSLQASAEPHDGEIAAAHKAVATMAKQLAGHATPVKGSTHAKTVSEHAQTTAEAERIEPAAKFEQGKLPSTGQAEQKRTPVQPEAVAEATHANIEPEAAPLVQTQVQIPFTKEEFIQQLPVTQAIPYGGTPPNTAQKTPLASDRNPPKSAPEPQNIFVERSPEAASKSVGIQKRLITSASKRAAAFRSNWLNEFGQWGTKLLAGKSKGPTAALPGKDAVVVASDCGTVGNDAREEMVPMEVDAPVIPQDVPAAEKTALLEEEPEEEGGVDDDNRKEGAENESENRPLENGNVDHDDIESDEAVRGTGAIPPTQFMPGFSHEDASVAARIGARDGVDMTATTSPIRHQEGRENRQSQSQLLTDNKMVDGETYTEVENAYDIRVVAGAGGNQRFERLPNVIAANSSVAVSVPAAGGLALGPLTQEYNMLATQPPMDGDLEEREVIAQREIWQETGDLQQEVAAVVHTSSPWMPALKSLPDTASNLDDCQEPEGDAQRQPGAAEAGGITYLQRKRARPLEITARSPQGQRQRRMAKPEENVQKEVDLVAKPLMPPPTNVVVSITINATDEAQLSRRTLVARQKLQEMHRQRQAMMAPSATTAGLGIHPAQVRGPRGPVYTPNLQIPTTTALVGGQHQTRTPSALQLQPINRGPTTGMPPGIQDVHTLPANFRDRVYDTAHMQAVGPYPVGYAATLPGVALPTAWQSAPPSAPGRTTPAASLIDLMNKVPRKQEIRLQ